METATLFDDDKKQATIYSPAAAFPNSDIKSTTILGTEISLLTPQTFVAALEGFFNSTGGELQGAYVCFRDVHGIIRARDDRRLADAHRNSLANVADGVPLVWLARLRGMNGIARVCGPDTMPLVCSHGVSKNWRHVLFGSTPETIAKLQASLERTIPGVKIVDAISPPFREATQPEIEQTLARIRDARPHFVWVGLGSPKQELWMASYAAKIPGCVSMGVGAAFDMHGGIIQRAPKFLRQSGLEFLFRIAQEPKRLAGRYCRAIPRFILGAALEQLGLWRGAITNGLRSRPGPRAHIR